MQKHYWIGLLLVVGMVGCTRGDLAVVEPQNALESPNDALIEHGEVSYLGEGFDEGTPQAGYHELRPNRPFRGVSFMLTSNIPVADYSVLRPDGSWSEFRPMNYDWEYRKFQNNYIEFDQPVEAFRLRIDDTSAEFLRLEFHDFPVGEADPHDDSEVDFLTELAETFLGSALARSGRWALPADVAAAGSRQNVGYDSAPSFSTRNCSGRLTDGARALGDYLTDNFHGARFFQGYNCRRIRGSSKMSMHGTGRAIDVFVPLDRGQADNDLGDEVANFLVENAEELGVQLIIWDRTIWTPSRGQRAYSGAHPHHDHLHVEITRVASQRTRISLQPEPQPEPEPQPGTNPGTTPTPEPIVTNSWVGWDCTSDAQCGFTSGSQRGFCWKYNDGSQRGFCSLSCEGLCPDKRGEAFTFCVDPTGANRGICASRSATQNNFCSDIAGTDSTAALRYVGSSGITVRQRDVCLP